MSTSPSIMALHFRYRLWIAEMNADINVLRIFEDYAAELATKNSDPAVKKGIADFKNEFVGLRTQIDELRHEMHLCKMSLAADARESTQKEAAKGKKKPALSADHAALKKRYTTYRKKFNTVKKEFGLFEARWL
ncbi:MAG: hypothetical protein P4L51_17305 [Puia sp.]|nr:hypothetical protein [Puia sp.]